MRNPTFEERAVMSGRSSDRTFKVCFLPPLHASVATAFLQTHRLFSSHVHPQIQSNFAMARLLRRPFVMNRAVSQHLSRQAGSSASFLNTLDQTRYFVICDAFLCVFWLNYNGIVTIDNGVAQNFPII